MTNQLMQTNQQVFRKTEQPVIHTQVPHSMLTIIAVERMIRKKTMRDADLLEAVSDMQAHL